MKLRTVSSFLICLSLLSALNVAPVSAKEESAADKGVQSVQSDKNSTDNHSNSTPTTDTAASSGTTEQSGAEKGSVNNLANLEALLNIIANGCEILGLAIGVPLCLAVPVGLVFVFRKGKRLIGALMIFTGPLLVTAGLATPGLINGFVAFARDAGLFT